MNELTQHIIDLNENLPTSTRLRCLLESMDEELGIPIDRTRSADILRMIKERQNKRNDESQD